MTCRTVVSKLLNLALYDNFKQSAQTIQLKCALANK